MALDKVKGFGISCDLEGILVEILYDNFNIEDYMEIGKKFSDFVDKGSKEKALDFIRKIKDEDAVYNWELNIPYEDKLKVIPVSGFRVNEKILIFGARSIDEMFLLIEDLSVNHEQTKALQGVMKYFTAPLREQMVKGSDLYDEIGRLNNELTNTQRELTKKNIQLTELNQQKEILLKEIHHRVKNNLMIISSLLNLQSRYIKDKESQEIFKESQNRAKSMALIHQRLYQSTDLKNIDFKEYITTLANDLYRTYVNDPSRVNLKLNIEDFNIDINAAIPLGLILNELITNSMKHAFPDEKKGTISIDFGRNGDLFVLIVSDDGVGFPEDLDYQNTNSLGLQLVNSLTSQISGELELNRTEGTTFKITFPEKKI